MQNFSNNQTTILKELSNGNYELGEGFAMALDSMVIQNGITNLKSEPFDVVSPSWKKLADKPDKTPEENKHLNDIMREEVTSLAESYLLFIAKSVRNLTGRIDYKQYEEYMLKYRFGKDSTLNKPEYLQEVKLKIRHAFDKISAHGETTGDNIIDKKDMAVFLYALLIKMKADRETKKIEGFFVNGTIKPRDYAIDESFLFEDSKDNYFTLKLQISYNFLYGVNKDK